MFNINDINSEIKRIFFQVLATGNKFICKCQPGMIKYNINDAEVLITYFKNVNYIPIKDYSNTFKLDYRIITVDYTSLSPVSLVNSKYVKFNFTINIDGVDAFDIDLTEEEYADVVRILDNVIKDYKLDKLNSIDEITENCIENDD